MAATVVRSASSPHPAPRLENVFPVMLLLLVTAAARYPGERVWLRPAATTSSTSRTQSPIW
ncbi:hypothetical protein [Dactylosporangium sp. NPDC048998]|uniref:hypothetical protein n=1 Tax=Dactylosporangium sp. NPDC048998 TaxID=3363976 RepID=UPI00371075FA